jgi:hypothetical protein
MLRREGKEHTLWENPQTGHLEAVPRHVENPEPTGPQDLPWPVYPQPAGLSYP